MEFLNRTWAEIDLTRLENNFNIIKNSVAENVKVMCVVKADGYGHGAVRTARMLDGKADYFAVSNIEEAIELRRANINTPILILGYTPTKFAKELEYYNITQTLLCFEYAQQLAESAADSNVTVKCHIKIDTGMNRIGFEYDDRRIIDICNNKHLDVEGIFTHFASSDKDGDKDGSFTRLQFNRLMSTIDRVEKQGFRFKIRHCCNSAATLTDSEYHLDMVRAGIILYGLQPSSDIITDGFEPVMSLKSTIALIKTVHKGENISYGRTYTADSDITVATLPIGYADGYLRSFANGGYVLVGNKPAPIVGRICMDQCMIDITGLDANVGDTVTMFGHSGSMLLPVENLARSASTINYEIICIISKRVGRVYLINDKIVDKSGLLSY